MKTRFISVTFWAGIIFLSSSSFASNEVAKQIESTKIHFGTADYALSVDARTILEQTVNFLEKMDGNFILKIIGFADNSGSDQVNQSLSVQRANAVTAFFVSQGIDPNRVLIQGMGSNQPIASNDSEEGRSENRRVEFKFISPDTSNAAFVASADSSVPAPPEEQDDAIEKALDSTPSADSVQTPPPNKEAATSSETKSEASEAKPSEIAKPEEKPVTPQIQKTEFAQAKDDTMIAEEKKVRNLYFRQHIYEDRKQKLQGQPYVELMPSWVKMGGANNVGSSNDSLTSDISIHGELGWSTTLEESFTNMFNIRAYGNIVRFNKNESPAFADDQKEFSFGGEMGLGKYFHPNVFFQVHAGYSHELIFDNSSGSLKINAEYIGHAGVSTEVLVWRYSEKGDVGLSGFFDYYDVGRGILDTGTGYGFDFFADYDFFRGGVAFTLLNLETTTYKYNTIQFGPYIRLYF